MSTSKTGENPFFFLNSVYNSQNFRRHYGQSTIRFTKKKRKTFIPTILNNNNNNRNIEQSKNKERLK